MTAVGYGIDFGTTNSAISIAYDDSVDVVRMSPRSALPTMLASMVYLNRDGLYLAGQDAGETYMVTGRGRHVCGSCSLVERLNGEADTLCRAYTIGGGCMDSRLLTGLKLDLADDAFAGTHSWAVDFPLEHLVAVALKRLKAAADRESGQDIRRAVFGFPLAFPGSEGPAFGRRNGIAWDRLEDAAHAAGFEEVARLAEPHAAAIVEQLDVGTVLAVDFGGGTFDVAVIEFSAETVEVAALQGAAIGGEQIDGDIFRLKVAAALGLQSVMASSDGSALSMPAWMQRRFASLAGVKHLVSNASVGVWLREHAAMPGGEALAPLRELLYGGQAYAFYSSIENAKMELSVLERSAVSFHRPGIEVEVELTRSELAGILRPYLTRIDECITAALAQAEVRDSDLAYVAATGGSSQLSAFQDYLAQRFGADRIRLRDPYNTVVTGLGYEAQNRWAS